MPPPALVAWVVSAVFVVTVSLVRVTALPAQMPPPLPPSPAVPSVRAELFRTVLVVRVTGPGV